MGCSITNQANDELKKEDPNIEKIQTKTYYLLLAAHLMGLIQLSINDWAEKVLDLNEQPKRNKNYPQQ